MTHLLRSEDYKPCHYKLEEDRVVLGSHVAQLFGVQIARILRGFPSIEDTWPTRENLFAIIMAVESIPWAVFQDINQCLHFDDDWDEVDGVD
jgi:hypothetical protein